MGYGQCLLLLTATMLHKLMHIASACICAYPSTGYADPVAPQVSVVPFHGGCQPIVLEYEGIYEVCHQHGFGYTG